MKFVVSSALLAERTQIISKIIPSKTNLPLLAYLLFSVKDNTLTITGSDSETTIVTSLPIEQQEGEGEIAILASQLDILPKFGEQPLTISVDERNFGYEIASASGKFNFIGQSGAEYPRYKTLDSENLSEFTIKPDVLSEGISKTFYAVAKGDVMHAIVTGICFDLTSEGLNLVGTDAHVLARFRIFDIKSDNQASFVLPQTPAQLLKNIIAKSSDMINVKFDDKNISFLTDSFSMICRCIEGKFPNYNAPIPQNCNINIIVDSDELRLAAERVAICTNIGTGMLCFKIENNQMNITGQDIDFSISGSENVSCQYEGEMIEFALKSSYLLGVLKNLNSPNVVIEMVDNVRPVLILPLDKSEDTDTLMLLTPMKLLN